MLSNVAAKRSGEGGSARAEIMVTDVETVEYSNALAPVTFK
jgi:hypothetical protein